MRHSEFWALMEQEFGGPYGRSVAARHALHSLADRTAEQALDDGVPARKVWSAVCEDYDVPEIRRFLQTGPPRD